MKVILLILFISILSSCSPEKEPIQFGTDACSFCKMTIVDQRYGAEVVTKKMKVYKFDAIECMINSLCENQENISVNLYSAYIIDFSNPGNLVDVSKSHFLHSESLPSPMGAYITGFSDQKSCKEALSTHGGEIYNWENVFLKVVGESACTHD